MIKPDEPISNIRVDSLEAKLKLASNKLDDIECPTLAKAVNDALMIVKDLRSKHAHHN